MNGVLVVDKPEDWTSFDVVARVRRLSGEKKIGHTGTLDPMATGVLPLLLGRAAKAADLLPDTSKTYQAGFRLGEATDTGDITGQVTGRSGILPDAQVLTDAAAAFTGTIRQVPPMYSAVSINGQRLYQLARQGKTVQRESREVFIEALEISAYSHETGTGMLEVTCSKGTYIRTLIEDIALKAGTLGVMTALRRRAACGFTEKDALTLPQLETLAQEGRLVPLETEALFFDYPGVSVSQAQAVRFQNGGALNLDRLKGSAFQPDQPIRVHNPEGLFLGLGQVDAERAVLSVKKLLF